MTEEYKLEVALRLIEELTNLIEGNEYEQFLCQHLIPTKYELERQLTNLQHHSKIKK
jgi:hypothetical protein